MPQTRQRSASCNQADALAAQDATEAHRQGAHGGKVGRHGFESVDLHSLGLRQQVAGLDAQCGGDDWRG
jgi:hypothetical protein